MINIVNTEKKAKIIECTTIPEKEVSLSIDSQIVTLKGDYYYNTFKKYENKLITILLNEKTRTDGIKYYTILDFVLN